MLEVDRYRIADPDALMTQALALFEELVDHNIHMVCALAGGAHNFFVHAKTHNAYSQTQPGKIELLIDLVEEFPEAWIATITGSPVHVGMGPPFRPASASVRGAGCASSQSGGAGDAGSGVRSSVCRGQGVGMAGGRGAGAALGVARVVRDRLTTGSDPAVTLTSDKKVDACI